MNKDSASSMYKIYSIAGTCSTAITVLLNKLEQPFTVIQRKDVANYSDIVATNQVPALQADNVFLTEGAASVLYLLERHPNTMLPGDVKGRAEFYRWLMFNYATLHPAHSKIYGLSRVAESVALPTELCRLAILFVVAVLRVFRVNELMNALCKWSWLFFIKSLGKILT